MEGVNTVSENTVSEKHPGGAPKGKRNARKHGLNTLKAAVTELGSRAIPGNTKLASLNSPHPRGVRFAPEWWPDWAGMGGRFAPEQVADLVRYTQLDK